MTAIYRIGYLARVPLRTPYPAIVAYVGQMLGKLSRGTELVIDYTGVGRPIFDMFTFSGIVPIGVLITGGASVNWDGQIVSVPKIVLVSRLTVLLHEGRLKVHRDLPEGKVLAEELRNFRASYTEAGHLTFNARSGKHDDLLLATGLAGWYLEDRGWPGGVFDLYAERAARLNGMADAMRERFVIGVDLGQSNDATAICVMSRVESQSPADPTGKVFEEAAVNGNVV
jgi:hypothetical protein